MCEWEYTILIRNFEEPKHVRTIKHIVLYDVCAFWVTINNSYKVTIIVYKVIYNN